MSDNNIIDLLINKFTIRNKQRQMDKIPFVKYIESQKGTDECEFKKIEVDKD